MATPEEVARQLRALADAIEASAAINEDVAAEVVDVSGDVLDRIADLLDVRPRETRSRGQAAHRRRNEVARALGFRNYYELRRHQWSPEGRAEIIIAREQLAARYGGSYRGRRVAPRVRTPGARPSPWPRPAPVSEVEVSLPQREWTAANRRFRGTMSRDVAYAKFLEYLAAGVPPSYMALVQVSATRYVLYVKSTTGGTKQ